jgi:hypothetical protein
MAAMTAEKPPLMSIVPRVKIETALFDVVQAEVDALYEKLRPDMERLERDPRVLAGTHHVTVDVERRDNPERRSVEVVATPRIVETLRFDDDE